METLTKAEIEKLVFALEELFRDGKSGDDETERLHLKLKVMYTTFVRAESHESKKAYCPLCGGELVVKND